MLHLVFYQDLSISEAAAIMKIGLGSARPSLLLRIGHAATAMPYSLRRPPTQTILTPR